MSFKQIDIYQVAPNIQKIIGAPASGKSTYLSGVLLRQVANNRKCIAINLENSDWINRCIHEDIAKNIVFIDLYSIKEIKDLINNPFVKSTSLIIIDNISLLTSSNDTLFHHEWLELETLINQNNIELIYSIHKRKI